VDDREEVKAVRVAVRKLRRAFGSFNALAAMLAEALGIKTKTAYARLAPLPRWLARRWRPGVRGSRLYELRHPSALSRLRPDKDGRVSVARLREKLPHVPYERMILPALIRLEEQGVVTLVQTRT